MKIKDIIVEDSDAVDTNDVNGGTRNIEPEMKAALTNAQTFPALNMSTGRGGSYMNYRMSIALAGAPDYPTKMAADNWIGGDPLLSPYTELEQEMVNAAAKAVGGGQSQKWSGDRSKEIATTYKQSPVASPKKNKYGV
jgi:hypothetical protein